MSYFVATDFNYGSSHDHELWWIFTGARQDISGYGTVKIVVSPLVAVNFLQTFMRAGAS